MIAMRRPSLVSCVNGTTAVEFAMVLPPFLMFLLGTMSASVAVYTEASLHYAAEGAARFYSVSSVMSGQCGSATTTQSNAKTLYHGRAVQHSRHQTPLAAAKSMERSMLCSTSA